MEIHQRPSNEGFSATQPPRFPSRVFLFSLRALGKSGPVFPSASPPNLRKALGKGQISSFLSQLCRQHLSSLTEINLVCERGDKLKGRETQEGLECWSSSFFFGWKALGSAFVSHLSLCTQCAVALQRVSIWGRRSRANVHVERRPFGAQLCRL